MRAPRCRHAPPRRALAATVAGVACLAASRRARAIDPPDRTYRVLPCRPTIACTADIVPPGVVEIEVGYLQRVLAARSVQRSSPFLLKLTLARWVQLQVSGNGGVFADGAAPTMFFDDVVAGFKFHVVDQRGAVPSVALSAEFGAPTWLGQIGYVRTYDLYLTAYASRDFGPLHVDLNVGLSLWRLEAAPLTQGWIALAFSGDIGSGFGLMVEGYGFSDASPVAPADAGVLSAATYSPRTWWMFDVGTDVGLVRSTRVASLFVGMTIIVADLWNETGARARRVAIRPTPR